MSDHTEYKSVWGTYKSEIGQALTEFLFGNDENLDPLDFTDPRVKYYVVERESAGGRGSAPVFDAERTLFERFWPPAACPQVLQLVGGSGSGKSTFIRYFFQYFLPYYETLIHGLDAASKVSIIHERAFRRHILLWADLRRPQLNLRSFVFNRLGRSLHHVAKGLALANDFEGEYTEEQVWSNISHLAKETTAEERKWYISWVFDNSDQLTQAQQLDLTNIVLTYIPEQSSSVSATEPVLDGQSRDLWRIIVPIRPETQTNLARSWDPLRNRDTINLDPIKHVPLVEKRADFVFTLVNDSMRHHQPDPHRITEKRADWELGPPEDIAKVLYEDILAANRFEHETQLTSRESKELLDQLVNNSARRRLILLPRVALSHIFRERKARGLKAKWAPPLVTPFYFFNALIRGDSDQYYPHETDCLILNLYDLGITPGKAHSIFVGLHAVYLLSQGRQWSDVKASLEKMGYIENDVAKCEQWLVNKELMKELWQGGYQVESSVVKGHWDLLKETAYTDNMAAACASSWGSPEQAPPTDPLDPRQLLRRFGGSLWFMKRIWQAERMLPVYSADVSAHWGTFADFDKFHKELGLRSVTHYVADEYLDMMQKLRDYDKPDKVIKSEQEQWGENISELNALVKESKDDHALDARYK